MTVYIANYRTNGKRKKIALSAYDYSSFLTALNVYLNSNYYKWGILKIWKLH